MAYEDFLIAVNTLTRHLRDPGWRVVDCRFDLAAPGQGHADYLAGHIPGAVYAHLNHDLAAPVTPTSGRHPLPRPEDFAATLGRWGISAGTRVVAYDQGSGAIAARLWWMLRWLGHRQVVLLDGGFEAWHSAGPEIEREAPVIEPASFEGRADERMIVSTDELREVMRSGAALLVDARAAARFAGVSEPIDTVAGHIPGARNFPFGGSLERSGLWRRREELETAWAETLGDDRDRDWITMCGSGVTACHLALSAERAGFRAPRLYPGSFSEWIRDPARPVATGPE